MKAITLQQLEKNFNQNTSDFLKIIKEKSKVHSFQSLLKNIKSRELVVVASRPNVGKTNFLFNLLINQEIEKDEKILLLALRDKPETVLLKLDKLISNSSTIISKNNILLNTEPFKNPIEAQEFIEKAISEHSIKGIYIDDLWALSWLNDLFEDENQEAIIDSWSDFVFMDKNFVAFLKFLGILSIEQNVPIILTEETTRANKLRSGFMGMKHILSDIKNPLLETIADKVLLLYRESYYDITEDADGNSTENVMKVTIAKNKNGISDKELTLKMDHNQLYH